MPLAPPSSAPLSVQRINPLDDSGWDARLARFPDATFFHGAAWARVLHDTYGFRPEYFVVAPRAGGAGPEAPVGGAVLPLMEVDSWLTGRRGVSLPFTDACAPLTADGAAFSALGAAVRDRARERAWKYWECRGGRPQFGAVPASTSFWGHQLELSSDVPALLSRLESSTRRAVRKAEQSGLTIEFSRERADMQTFYGLLCGTRRRLGVPPQPWRFFENIQRLVLARNDGWVVLARHGRLPVAGAVYFQSGRTAIYKFGASDDRWQHLRANNLVMWEAIRQFARQGLALLDFGRTSLANEGLRRYKLGWGSVERAIEYVRYDARSGDFVTARDQSSGWHSRVFRLLPLPISRMIGASLYKHVG